MMPVLFTVGDFTIRTYLLFALLAIFSVVVLIRYYEVPRLKAQGRLHSGIINYNGEALLIAVLGTVIGARLAYVIVNWDLYSDAPLRILALWRGGYAFHGALILAFFVVTLHAYSRAILPGKMLDLAMPYVTFGYGLGRLGCFFNGCCYGHVTSLPVGLVYPAIDAQPRHPTQLYSFIIIMIIAIILFIINRNSFALDRPGGIVFAWFLILTGSYRFGVEYFRVSEIFAFNLTLAQLVSLFMLLGGVMLLFILKYKEAKNTGV